MSLLSSNTSSGVFHRWEWNPNSMLWGLLWCGPRSISSPNPTLLPQGFNTYSSLCLESDVHMTHILQISWLKRHLFHDAFPNHLIYHFNCLLASTLECLRSCPCLIFPPALNTIQHIALIYLLCCHAPVPLSSEHSGIETRISVWGSLCANVTNAVINCALSLLYYW